MFHLSSMAYLFTIAGTGTILDAWKVGLPIIVVPNTRLLDDHQTEMAKHLSREGYATRSKPRHVTHFQLTRSDERLTFFLLSSEDLQEAIHKAELLFEDNKSRWPPHEVVPKQNANLRLWEIGQNEVSREENSQMAHD